MMERKDYKGIGDYFDKDDKAQEYYKSIKERVFVDLFKNQQKFLYMYGELGKGRKPMLKDDAYWFIREKVVNNFSDMIDYMVMDIIHEYYHYSDIDVPYGIAEDVNFYLGAEDRDNPDHIEGLPSPEEE